MWPELYLLALKQMHYFQQRIKRNNGRWGGTLPVSRKDTDLKQHCECGCLCGVRWSMPPIPCLLLEHWKGHILMYNLQLKTESPGVLPPHFWHFSISLLWYFSMHLILLHILCMTLKSDRSKTHNSKEILNTHNTMLRTVSFLNSLEEFMDLSMFVSSPPKPVIYMVNHVTLKIASLLLNCITWLHVFIHPHALTPKFKFQLTSSSGRVLYFLNYKWDLIILAPASCVARTK